jgi:excisionase family DNA binding protein
MNDANDPWLSIEDAAKQLGLDTRTMRRLIEKERLPVFHLERGYKVRQSVLDTLVTRRTRPLTEGGNAQ